MHGSKGPSHQITNYGIVPKDHYMKKNWQLAASNNS
jgi:hypothetical protein